MDETLVELFRHNLWANLRLLDVCAGLESEQLDASAPGTYGRVRDTLLHIIVAEERYTVMLSGQQPDLSPADREARPGFEELRQRASRSGEELIRIAPEVHPAQELKGVRRDRPFSVQAGVLLIQAINHATEHRAHVVTILSQLGINPPPLDGWTHGRERGAFSSGS